MDWRFIPLSISHVLFYATAVEPTSASAAPSGAERARQIIELCDRGSYQEARQESARFRAEAGPDEALLALETDLRVTTWTGFGHLLEALGDAQRLVADRRGQTPPAPLDLAAALDILASIQMARGLTEDAQKTLGESEALYEQSGGPRGRAGVEHQLLVVAQQQSVRRWDAAQVALDRAESLMREEHIAQPVLAARAATSRARIAYQQERFEDSVTAASVAISALEDAGLPEHPQTVRALNARALAEFVSNHLDDALRDNERAYQIAQKRWPPGSAGAMEATSELGRLLVDRDPQRARPLLEECLHQREAAFGPDSLRLVGVLTTLTKLRPAGDKVDPRSAIFRRLLTLIGERPTVELHDALRSYAQFLWEQGDLAGALAQAERTLDVARATGSDDSSNVAYALLQLGRLAQATGDRRRAEDLLRDALSRLEKTYGIDSYDAALAHWELAFAVDPRRAQDRSTELEKTVEMLEHAALPTDDLPMALSDLAMEWAVAGRLVEARAAADRAVQLWLAGSHGTQAFLARAYLTLGFVEERSGEFVTAERTYERALAENQARHGWISESVASLSSLAVMRLMRKDPVGSFEAACAADEQQKAALLTSVRKLDERTADRIAGDASWLPGQIVAAARHVSGAERSRIVRAAWDRVLRRRTLVFDEASRRRRRALAAPDSETLRLSANLADVRERLARLVLSRDPRHRGKAAAGEAAALTAQKTVLERELAERSTPDRDAQSRESIGLSEVLGALPPRTALVAFVRYYDLSVPSGPVKSPFERHWVERYAAFVASAATEPRLIDLGRSTRIRELVFAWLAATAQPTSVKGTDLRRTGRELRTLIWEPLVPHIRGCERVLIVPDGDLAALNLATLPDEKGFLIENGPEIHYLTSERDVAVSRRSQPTGRGLLAIGAPDFERTAPDVHVASLERRTTFRGPTSACRALRDAKWTPLPWAKEETTAIATSWRRGHLNEPADVLVGPAATEDAVKTLAPGRQTLHLATHGFFLDPSCGEASFTRRRAEGDTLVTVAGENPLLRAGIVLAGAMRDHSTEHNDDEDGILTAEEIVSLDLSRLDWAVLSACDTAWASATASGERYGLPRAFLLAGARSVIASQWSVPDNTTRTFMEELYDGRARGLSTSGAVRAASIRVLNARRKAGLSDNPFWWGAFISVGDWR